MARFYSFLMRIPVRSVLQMYVKQLTVYVKAEMGLKWRSGIFRYAQRVV